MKRVISLLTVWVLVFTALNVSAAEETAAEPEEENTQTEITDIFTDVEDSWAKEDIRFVYEKGIMNGTSDTVFDPEEEVSRAQFAAMIFRVFKLSPAEYQDVYPDVTADDWYAEILQTLCDLKIIDREIFDGQFNGDDAITREEMAVLLANASKLFFTLPAEQTNLDFNDADDCSDWAVAPVGQMAELGILEGENGSFHPADFMTRAEAAAVVHRTMDVLEQNGLNTAQMPWRQAPVIFRLSDEVKPGNVLMIYGYGMDDAELKIWADTATETQPSETAIELSVLQNDEGEGCYASTILPEDFPAGIAKIWVENQYGISNGLLLNAARPVWISWDIGYEGTEMTLIGHNFELTRVGGEANDVQVKLVQGEEEYPAEVVEVGPYAVKFLVPGGMEEDVCDIWVTNDGTHWAMLDNEQTFTIVEKGEDPLGLNVPWEIYYHYDNQVEITDFGAVADDDIDDTDAIKAAIDALDEQDGGIVWVPEGEFLFHEIRLPSYIILAGRDRNKSVLKWIYDFENKAFPRAIETVAGKSGEMPGYNGIYNMTFRFDPTNPDGAVPSNFTWLGDPWSNYTATKSNDRQYEGFFWKDVTVDFPMEIENGNHSVMRSYTIIEKYFLFENCDVRGYQTPPGMPVYGNYSLYKDNYLDNILSTIESVGSYTILENNELVRHGNQFDAEGNRLQSQGIFVRTNAYCTKNKISGTGGDGESITTDANKQNHLIRGAVVDADLTSVRVEPFYNPDGVPESIVGLIFDGTTAWDMSYPCFGTYSILICDGKGMGQIRKVTGANEERSTIQIDKPWDIIPDQTSRFTVFSPNENVIYYDNESTNTVVGFAFYGAHYDCVIADCHTKDSLGLKLTAIEKRGKGSSDSRFWGNYFISYIGNTCEGVSPTSKDGTIGFFFLYENDAATAPLGYTGYGLESRENHLMNVLTQSTTSYGNGMRVQSANTIDVGRDMVKAVNIEGNTMENILETGLYIGTNKAAGGSNSPIKGVILKDNIYQNVKNHKALYDTQDVITINE